MPDIFDIIAGEDKKELAEPALDIFDQLSGQTIAPTQGFAFPEVGIPPSITPEIEAPSTLEQAATNLPASLGRLASGFGEMLMHPINTAQTVSDLASGLSAKLFGNEQESVFDNYLKEVATRSPEMKAQVDAIFKSKETQRDIADAFVDDIVESYGSFENIKRTFEEDPARIVFDFATLASGAGSMLKGVATAGRLGKTGQVLGAIGKPLAAADPIRFTFSGLDKAADITGVRRLVDKGMGKAAEILESVSLKIKKGDTVKIMKGRVAGVEPGIWMSERGIAGSIGGMIKQLGDIKVKTIAKVDWIVNKIKFRTQTKTLNNIIVELSKAFKSVKSGELLIIKNELTRLDHLNRRKILPGLRDRPGRLGLTPAEMNRTKRILDEFLNPYGRSNADLSVIMKKDLGHLRNELKSMIEKSAAKEGFPNLAALNKQTQIASEIRSALKSAQSTGAANRIITLTDWIIGSAGMVYSPLASVGLVLTKKVMESPAFLTRLSRQIKGMSPSGLTQLESMAMGDSFTSPMRRTVLEMMRKAAVESTKAVGAPLLFIEGKTEKKPRSIFGNP